MDRAVCGVNISGLNDHMICAGIPEGGKDTCQVNYNINTLAPKDFNLIKNIYVIG